jgi:kumamolisin
VIGILELGGSWTQSDLDQFSTLNGLPRISVTDVSVDGGGPGAPGADPNADGEVALDIQVAAAAYFYATGHMPSIRVYWAPNSFQSFTAAINRAASDQCDVLSISWGSDEGAWETVPILANDIEASSAAATTNGMAIFAAAGDNSSSDGAPGANVDLPSACPHVVGCGGTTKTSFSEVVWGDGRPDGRGTGGGYSDIFGPQSWQINAPPRTTPGAGGRMVPDVAANADPNTGYLVVVNGTEVQIGGTSAVAPFYAGLFASFGRRLGWVAPKLWQNPNAFVDITQGSNGSYFAAIGPDPCTGLGVPNGTALRSLFSSAANSGQAFLSNVPNLKFEASPPIDSICSVYAMLKPILQVIIATPFLPANWKVVVNEFMGIMDTICKAGNAGVAPQAAGSLDVQVQAADSQVRSGLTSYLQSRSAVPAGLDLAGIPGQICPIYKKIKPILNAIKGLLPATWRLAIELAEEAFDQICGTAVGS